GGNEASAPNGRLHLRGERREARQVEVGVGPPRVDDRSTGYSNAFYFSRSSKYVQLSNSGGWIPNCVKIAMIWARCSVAWLITWVRMMVFGTSRGVPSQSSCTVSSACTFGAHA